MTKQDKPEAEQQGDALTPGAIAVMREPGYSAQQIEAERRNAERIKAAGGFSNWVMMNEAARIASEARGYPVEPEAFTVTRFPDARAKLDSMAGVRQRTSIVGWADAFALELAILNSKSRADRVHAHRFEQAMLQAARKGVLRMRTFDAVGAPVEVTANMAEDVITQRLATDTEDVRAWAAQHWPELAESRLLAEPQAAPASPDSAIKQPEEDLQKRDAEIVEYIKGCIGRRRKDYIKCAVRQFNLGDSTIRKIWSEGKPSSNFPRAPKRPR
jgi:hypothetical protein